MAETVGMAGGGVSAGLGGGGGGGGGMVVASGRPPSIHRDGGDLVIAEESEKSSGGGSPSPTRGSPGAPRTISNTPPLTQQQLQQHHQQHIGNSNNTNTNNNNNNSTSSSIGNQSQQQQQQQNVSNTQQQHHPQSQSPGLGSPLGMLRGLQGLSGLPQISQQMSQLAANLQGLASQTPLPNQPTAGLSSPLNLSVGGSGLNPTNNGSNSSSGGLLQPALPSPMPQLILASGQLVQGIQGAQLLIPTSQGIATQTILTIPVNQVSSNDQMVNLALNNGQVVSTSLANLQAMAQPHQLLNNQQANAPSAAMRNNLLNQSANAALTNALLNPAALSGLLANGGVGAQQLLQAMQQPQNHLLSGHMPSQHLHQNNASSTVTNQQLQGNQHSPSSNSWNDQSSQHLNQQRHYKDRDTPYHHQNNHGDSSFLGDLSREKNNSRERERDRDRENLTNGMNGSCSNQSAVAAAAALSSISRLAASNGELTITAARSTGSPGGGGGGRTPPCKSSPASTEPEDLLADSPDQPTINQASTNMVDGINLDDIKEFAKAFKLRRLSLGLTQTQVGQALSVTEGPAYSQSAICSALASQMFAAQLSTQQPNIFEKLDITPKSAQKIKPVLERWMKEAEERYASGQSHLTDFIGMEPSKKRKRRTSFTPQALELLNAHFERNTHPSGTEITGLAHQLGYEREVIRIWFCNKRQALKNTVRMMSKGMV